MISNDVLSMINPAFGSLVLWSFLVAYQERHNAGCELIVLFLPLPLCLSKSMRDMFRGTNSSTGLLTWVNRHPEILLSLPENVEKSTSFSRESIIFGMENNILEFGECGRILGKNSGYKRKPTLKDLQNLKDVISVSKTLGSWCGQIQSTELIYNYLGIGI